MTLLLEVSWLLIGVMEAIGLHVSHHPAGLPRLHYMGLVVGLQGKQERVRSQYTSTFQIVPMAKANHTAKPRVSIQRNSPKAEMQGGVNPFGHHYCNNVPEASQRGGSEMGTLYP